MLPQTTVLTKQQRDKLKQNKINKNAETLKIHQCVLFKHGFQKMLLNNNN